MIFKVITDTIAGHVLGRALVTSVLSLVVSQ
jgi:hypothetical protein